MPEPLLRILRTLGQELTAAEVMDVLWLAQRLPAGPEAPLRKLLAAQRHDAVRAAGRASGEYEGAGRSIPEVGSGPQYDGQEANDVHSAPEPQPGRDAVDEDIPGPGGDSADYDPEDTETRDGDSGTRHDEPADAPPEQPKRERGLPVRLPRPRSLPSFLGTARALRPLKRYRADFRRTDINENATVVQIAATGMVDVVSQPRLERWLDLALIIDDGPSMLLWQQSCRELRSLCERLGAFRHIRVRALRPGPDGSPMLADRPFARAQRLIAPKALADPSGRTMTLMISDGAGPLWRSGALEPVLRGWAAQGPTAVVHALPARMWAGSALPARRWTVCPPHAGAANTHWQVRDPVLPPELNRFRGIPVPILEPSPEALTGWVRATVSDGLSATLPLWQTDRNRLAPKSDAGATAKKQAPAGRAAPSAATQVVREFRRAASPESYRLAAHLAALSPLTVPVMRLVAQAVPWKTDTAHLAEVFLSGLMRSTSGPEEATTGATTAVPVEQRLFTFTDEARDILLDAVPTAHLVETIRSVSQRIVELAGRNPDFPAWLRHSDGTDRLPEGARGFAWLGPTMLGRLGLAGVHAPAWADTPVLAPEPEGGTSPALLTDRVGLPAADPGTDPDHPHGSWEHLAPWDFRTAGPFELTGRVPRNGRNGLYRGHAPGDVLAAVRIGAGAVTRTEARALERFSHEGLPALLDHGRGWTATSFVSTESGGWAADLRVVVERTGPLGVEAALCLGQYVAAALAHSHSAGVVHGRLTPSRVALTQKWPVVVGWHHAAVDGLGLDGTQSPVDAADDVQALAEIVYYAAYARRLPAPGRGDPLNPSPQSFSGPDTDPAVEQFIRICRVGVRGDTPSAEVALALLRDRLPRDTIRHDLITWLPPQAAMRVVGNRLWRTAPQEPVRNAADDEPGAQVPISPRPAASPTGTSHRKGRETTAPLRLPGAPGPAVPTMRRWGRRTTPDLLGAVFPHRRRCIAVAGPALGGRSTVAVQLASVLAGLRRGRHGVPVVMTPVNEHMQVFGYRLLSSDRTRVAAEVPRSTTGAIDERWVTLTDSSGAHFLYSEGAHAEGTQGWHQPYDVRRIRREMEWLRTLGTVVVDVSGDFVPPDSSPRTLLGSVDHLVIATAGEEDFETVPHQLEWLSSSGYRDLVQTATLVLSDTRGGQRSRSPVPQLRHGEVPSGVVVLPFDQVLRDRGLADFSELAQPTRRAFEVLGRRVDQQLGQSP
ncbi:SAV_2336 N-terminal domain-related protein [Streptomyces sp. NPDC001312]|uniref:SAV_2336 N-terminal domain-related protein n=1 Tax=Streptomyces sp. NPDC001312 TaxID=3364561 RepID=UPI0036AF2EEF